MAWHEGLAVTALVLSVLVGTAAAEPQAEGWVPLFNGRDLEGWTVKIAGHEIGDNYGKTFRVEDGLLKVSYDRYPEFAGRFGHLFLDGVFDHYRLLVEYRFVGEQVAGGPEWALRNSGIMIHGQSPESMALDQAFPVSIEVQLLGGNGEHPRPTANLCTPGTHVLMGGELITRHCTESRSRTYHGDDWVTVVVEVRGSHIEHRVQGETVLTYTSPRLDASDPEARKLLEAGGDWLLERGTISLQSESHPVEFRRIALQRQ